MTARDIILNRAGIAQPKLSPEKQFALDVAQLAIERKYGVESTSMAVGGVVAGAVGGVLLYHLLFRKRKG